MIPAFLRHLRNQHRLTLEKMSAKVGMSPQNLSEIERMAEATGMTVLIVPEAMAPKLRRYIAHNGRTYTPKTLNSQPFTGQPSHQQIGFHHPHH